MKVTRHRDKILEALREWFRIHKESPTLEELCLELAMKPRQKATLQRWLQTLRGIDVEWDDNYPRSLRLLREDPPTPEIDLSATETLRYLATGLTEWEQQEEKTASCPETLRLGMSRMYLTSLLQGDNTTPANWFQFWEWAQKPVITWKPAQEIPYLSEEVTLIEDGYISDFTREWCVSGKDKEKEIEQKNVEDALIHCRNQQLEESYRAFRHLIITRPVLPYGEFRKLLSKDLFRPLREFLTKIYVNLEDFCADDIYHFCPRCGYIQRQHSDGSYTCYNQTCEKLAIQGKLPPLPTIRRDDDETYKVVTTGVHQYTTLPGLWEIHLQKELLKLGFCVTLWPKIDAFDLLVEVNSKVKWAIDVKDWSYLEEENLKKVQYRPDTQETFIVFPDTRESELKIKIRREDIEPSLNGVRLRLISEILTAAGKFKEKENHA